MLCDHIFQLLVFLILAIAWVEARSVVFDPNPLASFNIENTYNCNTFFSSISQDNLYAFVSAAQCGVFIISLKNKINPQLVSQIPGKSAFSTNYLNGILFISDQQDGLSIYNLADPSKPVLLYKWQVTVRIQCVALTSNLQYAFALGNGIVYSISLSDLKNPQTLDYTGVLAPESYRLKLSKDETHLCVSNHIQGIQIYDVRNKSKIQLRVNQNPVFVIWDCIFTPDQTAIYAVDTYNGLFYANVQQVFNTPQGSTAIYTLTFQSIYTTPQIQQSITMTQDGLYLVLGLRSIGLVLFEIESSNYLKPTFVQRLNGNYLSNDVFFSFDDSEKYAFVTNGMSILIFMQAQINTNKDFPNIFNTFQSSLTPLTSDLFPWQILCLQKSQNIIQTNNANGALIYDITNPYYPKQITSIPIRNGSFGGFALNAQETLLYMSGTQDGLMFYNITNISSPEYIKNYTPLNATEYKNQGVGVTLDKSGTILLLSNGFYGFGVLNITDPLNYKQIGLYINSEYPCGFEKCVITSDLKTIICACREIGLFFFDFTNLNLSLVKTLDVLGSEYLILSKNEQYAFVCNGFQGILIVNIQDKTNPKIIGNQPLDGWAQSLISLFDETYLLVSQIEKGELVVVNIQNLINPYIQSKLTYPGESSQSLCLTTDSSTALFVGSQGMRSIPVETSLTIHTQIQVQQTDSNGNTYYEDLTIGDSLLVGQTAQVFFVPLYISQNIKFSNVYYYRNFEIQTLPSWITFYQSTNSLQILVDKAGAHNTFSKDTSGENIIILDCLISLSASNFITTNINSTLSTQIYTTLVNSGYLDTQGQLTSQLDPTIEFYLNFFDDANFTTSNVGTAAQIALIQQDIKQILVFSRVQYPARFFIQSSLFFNYESISSSSSTNLIVSPSLQISILLQIQSNAIFVKKNFDGVLTTFSDDLTSVKLQGQTYYVNQIVTNSILIANKTENLTDIVIDVILSDSSNYDISLVIPLSNLTFFKLYQPMQVDQNNTLQTQLNKQYSSGHLQVENRYQFTFDMDTFIQQENLTLSYSAYIVDGSTELTQITSGNWIEFNSFNLGFSGQKTIGALLDSYRIRLVATDGYSTIYDEFSISFTQIPFTYVIQLLVQIVGPIIGIFGVWKYRADIFIFTMSKYYMFGDEIATVGQLYKKQIVLIDELWEDAMKLWKAFLSQNKNFPKEIIEEYTQNQTLDMPVIIALLYHTYSSNEKQYSEIDPREFEFHDSRLVRIVKRLCYQIVLNKDKSTSQALKQLKQLGKKESTEKEWYKSFVSVNYNFEIQENEVVRSQQINQNQNNKSSSIANLKNVTQLGQNKLEQTSNMVQQHKYQNTTHNLKKQSFTDANYLDENQNQLIGWQSPKNDIKIGEVDQHAIFDLKSPSLFQAQELDSFDHRATWSNNVTSANQIQLVFKTKPHAIESAQKLEQKYTAIDNYDDTCNLNPFPEITVLFDEIQKQLRTQKPDLEWDKNLLSEILILEASGIGHKIPSRLNPAQGESMHLYSHQLLSIEAFKKDKEDTFCLCLKKFFKSNYSPIGLTENNPLPQWLNCQIVDDIVHLWGTPKVNDEPEFQVRIIDSLTFTVKSFHVKIKDQEGNFLKDKSNSFNINKIRSENKIVASMRILKQNQNCPNNVNMDSNIEHQMRTLSLIPRLSKFYNEVTNQQMKNRTNSTINPLINSPLNQQQLKNGFSSYHKEEGGFNFNENSPKDIENKKSIFQKDKNEEIVAERVPLEMEMVDRKNKNEEIDFSINQSSHQDMEEKTENEKIPKIEVADYIIKQI